MISNINKIIQLADNEKSLFQDSVNALLTRSFLVRGIDKDKRLYRFVLTNMDMFEAYFSCAGWSIRIDETLGVISWFGPKSSRLNLNLEETLSLLVFRLIFEDKRNDISLQEFPIIRLIDFIEKYEILTERAIKKTRLSEIIRRFQSLKLVKVQGDETDPDSQVILYSSILFALDSQNIDDIYSMIQNLTQKNDIETNISETLEEYDNT